jgi:isocitrate dehydrogenase (NAD+)
MAYKVTLLPGDGIGPEVAAATLRVIEATGVKIDWETLDAGEIAVKKYGTPLPDAVLASIRQNKIALKGPVTTPVGTGFRSVNVAIRKSLNLYANLRPCRTFAGIKSLYKNIDIIIVRENTEDLYAGVEFERGKPETRKLIEFIDASGAGKLPADSGISIKMISVTGSRKIVKFAFDYARMNGRHKVTAVHKANIMKYTDGLFLDVAREVAREYPDISFEDVIVDNMSQQLVMRPQQYDVIVAPNLYGDILSDLCAGLVGGLGIAPGADIGDDYAVFEAVHGSAPDIAGQNKANPMALMFTAAMMLKYLGEKGAGERIERALGGLIASGQYVTADLKSPRHRRDAVGTREVADAVIRSMDSDPC